MNSKKIVLVIPVYNKAELTDACLNSIFSCADANPDAEILIVDDGSDQATRDCLAAHPVTVLTNPGNSGYLTSTNRGIQYALDELKADFIVLMNNDLEVKDDWLGRLISVMDQYDLSGYSNAGKKWFLKKKLHRETSYLEGSCMVIKREVFERVGILDPVFLKGYYSDDDICLRAMIDGFSMGLVDNRKFHFVKHHGGLTFGAKKYDYMRSDYDAFVAKWEKQKGNAIVADYLEKWLFNPHNRLYRLFEWYLIRFYMPAQEKRLAR